MLKTIGGRIWRFLKKHASADPNRRIEVRLVGSGYFVLILTH
jgi:hypothetical protein